jgi:hypothetical protein
MGEAVDPTWSRRIASGLSSGEGLIHAVRDPSVDAKGNVDPGETDKRLMVVETEFSNTLKVINREGNVLSPVIRDAWDQPRLQVLARNTGNTATEPHISIIGHGTEADVRDLLTKRDMANGFANRYIWGAVRRWQLLPSGGAVPADQLQRLENLVKAAVIIAQTRENKEITRSAAAVEYWNDVYPELSAERDDLAGAITARAEAQVTRLSVNYALLDRSVMVEPVHLSAALALWSFSDRSVDYIFGRMTGDEIADRVFNVLCVRPDGMSRTEIRDLFNRNERKERIDRALSMLAGRGLIEMTTTKTTGGRPAEVWHAVSTPTTKDRTS